MNHEKVIIHIRSFYKGENILYPVLAMPVGNDNYQILMYANYNTEINGVWEFEQGSIVKCENDKQGNLLAVEKIGNL
jgi:hypothetical protein